jgi:GH15 family glucan-1,4-alpha-glucosidase
MDALFQSSAQGLAPKQLAWDLQCKLIEHLETIWWQPDEGIWEVPSGRRHFTHSKVMTWVAFDRAIKSVEQLEVNGPIERWRKVRAEILSQVCEKSYNAKVGAFVQSYGSSELPPRQRGRARFHRSTHDVTLPSIAAR